MSTRIEDRIVAFLAERPTHRFTRAGIALGIKTDRGSLLFPLRRLATWDQWAGEQLSELTGPGEVLCAVGDVLLRVGLINGTGATEDGRALLDRARKAGVL